MTAQFTALGSGVGIAGMPGAAPGLGNTLSPRFMMGMPSGPNSSAGASSLMISAGTWPYLKGGGRREDALIGIQGRPPEKAHSTRPRASRVVVRLRVVAV